MKRRMALIGVCLLFLAGCGDKVKPGSVEAKREPVTGVTLATINPSEVDAFYETAGTVKAGTVSLIAARVMGNVLSVKVKEGDRVRQGQELIILDDRDMAQRVTAAESGYAEARKGLEQANQNRQLADVTFKRYRNLADEKVITQQEMDQVETQKRIADLGYERAGEAAKGAQAQMAEARITSGFARITAPHAGLVTEKKIDKGSLAVPGTPLLVLEDTSQLKVEAFVDERLEGKVKTGTPVTVLLSGSGTQVTGTVVEIVPAVDPATRSFLIKAVLNDRSLRSGAYVKVFVPEGKKQVLLVPKNAVVEKGQLTGLYVVDDRNVMTYRVIRTGQTRDGRMEVVSGLKGGERIAIAGLEKCIDGGLVKQ